MNLGVTHKQIHAYWRGVKDFVMTIHTKKLDKGKGLKMTLHMRDVS